MRIEGNMKYLICVGFIISLVGMAFLILPKPTPIVDDRTPLEKAYDNGTGFYIYFLFDFNFQFDNITFNLWIQSGPDLIEIEHHRGFNVTTQYKTTISQQSFVKDINLTLVLSVNVFNGSDRINIQHDEAVTFNFSSFYKVSDEYYFVVVYSSVDGSSIQRTLGT